MDNITKMSAISFTWYAVLFLYTLAIQIQYQYLYWWSLTPRTERRGDAVHNSWCRRELNLKAREGRGRDSVAGAPSCLSISDMTTLQRQSYWFETKKQTSIYWSRCDELKCDTLVGGVGGRRVGSVLKGGGCGWWGDAPSATTRAIIPNTLIFRVLFSCTGFWHFFASLFAPVLRLHPFGARVLSSVIGFSHAALTLLHLRKQRNSWKCHLKCCTL